MGKPPSQICEKYRLIKGIVSDKINEALAKTDAQYIEPSNDSVFLGQITYVKDADDRQIIADAARWATQFPFRYFCTSDREHILIHKPDLELDINKHYGRNCLVFIHLEKA
jgi:hypothetical protein